MSWFKKPETQPPMPKLKRYKLTLKGGRSEEIVAHESNGTFGKGCSQYQYNLLQFVRYDTTIPLAVLPVAWKLTLEAEDITRVEVTTLES